MAVMKTRIHVIWNPVITIRTIMITTAVVTLSRDVLALLRLIRDVVYPDQQVREDPEDVPDLWVLQDARDLKDQGDLEEQPVQQVFKDLRDLKVFKVRRDLPEQQVPQALPEYQDLKAFRVQRERRVPLEPV